MTGEFYPYSGMLLKVTMIDNHLPKKVSYHVKIFLFAIVSNLIMLAIGKQSFAWESLLDSLILSLVLIELFIWVGYKIFNKGINLGETRQEITRNLVVRFTKFYIICFVLALVEIILFLYINYLIHGYDTNKVLYNFIHVEFRGWFRSINTGLLIGAFIFIVMIWQDALKQAQKLKEEKLIFQYETLKNQVNPHFLFNSLNTLSSLVGSDTELAERFIQKLSSIYRYVLEYREVETVDLTSEITFVNDYFYLQQTRDEDKISLDIEISEPERFKILPMSLQLLVENALKHNSATREKMLRINISQVDDFILVKNNVQRKLSMEPSPGIGLRNLRERVKYITRKELQVIESENEFRVLVPVIPK